MSAAPTLILQRQPPTRAGTGGRELADAMIERFCAPEGFYDASDDHESLIVQPRELQDNATPSGSGMAVTALLKLVRLSTEPRYVELAHQALAPMRAMMAQYPSGFGQWLRVLLEQR